MEEEARPSKKPRGAPGSGLTAFALRLAKQLAAAAAKDEGGGKHANLVFSPVSIYSALALLGAASLDELAEFLRGVTECALADLPDGGGPLVSLACGVWHEKTVALNPAYRAVAVESYKAETRAADFLNKAEDAREEINKWVSKATNRLIKSILPPDSVHRDTRLVLANAIYFKATSDTEDGTFYHLDGSRVRVAFMSSRRNRLIAQDIGFKVLKLPYKSTSHFGKHFSMCIFLPDARDGLPSLVEKMAAASPSFLWDSLPAGREVEVGKFRLPKFKLSFSSEMNDVLKAMGLKDVFEPGKANLSNMLEEGDRSLVLEHIFHKSVIEVNEKGDGGNSIHCLLD
ncbi:hypothetical protein EJB05_34777, partial [Eragrostis curvula]